MHLIFRLGIIFGQGNSKMYKLHSIYMTSTSLHGIPCLLYKLQSWTSVSKMNAIFFYQAEFNILRQNPPNTSNYRKQYISKNPHKLHQCFGYASLHFL